jgi:four helix bundle protein
MNTNTISIQERSFKFSLDIINLVEKLPKNYIYLIIAKQLIRAATSIGANVYEAQAGSSRRDFINYYHIALKSGNETDYWLKIIREKIQSKLLTDEVNLITKKLNEICKILGSSLISLKRK